MFEFRDIVQAVQVAQENREKAALASIVRIRGSSPRHNGARMLVLPDGSIHGTIGGGTLEYRVIEDARRALSDGAPRFLNYVFDASGRAGSVGLCGGTVDVHIAVDMGEFADICQAADLALERGENVVLASIVSEGDRPAQREHAYLLVGTDGRSYGSLGSRALEARVISEALESFADRASRLVIVGNEEDEASQIGVHLDLLEASQTLLIVGAGHVAQPLAAMGSMLGFRVCVVDDRSDWATRERFPRAAEIAVIDYEPVHEILAPIPFPMQSDTWVVITTWGYDLPAMEQALKQNPAYIGLVASPTKARVLFKRLLQEGFSDQEIQRIKAPVGLDIGAESPAELALSILAEILTEQRKRSGEPLSKVRRAVIDSLFANSMAIDHFEREEV